MKISYKEWVLFIVLAVLCVFLWYKFACPQLVLVNLSIDKKEALHKAEDYLKLRGIDLRGYSKAIVFDSDDWTDRYLQRTLGIKSEDKFIKDNDYELFFWKVRFFKQLQKEEYILEVSSKSGAIANFKHLIEDVEPREAIDKEIARTKAEEFLKDIYNLDFKYYDFHEEKIKRFDNRIDYTFSWEKRGVYIPWKENEGTAKLLIAAIVSGKEIREFHKDILDVPEKFKRHIENQLVMGEYLSSVSFLFFMLLIVAAIVIVVRKKSSVAARISKKWFLYLCAFFITINIIYILNDSQRLIINYPTNTAMVSFIGINIVRIIINIIFLSVTFIMPGIAGETLHQEVFAYNKESSFLHYLKSSFYTKGVAKAVIFGYLIFLIMLGFQAVIFYFGQQYLGVWKEWIKLTQFSSAYIPFLTAFIIGASASLSEEIVYRIFGINFGKKLLKNTFLAILSVSLIWGFGHSQYPVFPVWFRGIEVTLLGLFFGFIFIKYGIIPLLVAHYLFDVFWGVAAYIFGRSSIYLFFSSIFVLAIPFIFFGVAYFMNKPEKERDIKLLLDKVQEYNLSILITFISAKKSCGLSPRVIKEELLLHNWDVVLVDLAIDTVFKD